MKPLRGRFEKNTARVVEEYTLSLPYDKRLYREDIAGSVAHARMMARQNIISEKDAELIIMGLVSIRQEIEQGTFPLRPELEDIHMNIEARLTERIGATAGKLHTGRSRNDQVAVDMRLYVKETTLETVSKLRLLQQTLVELAQREQAVIMPGYTHLQRAQPILLAHHLLAYFEMLERDISRFRDCFKRTDVLPLGSGALAGVPYPIDRPFLAQELGFSRLSQNSLDAVSDRDFVVEYMSTASIAMMHLSRLAEELILWSSSEFGFIEIDDSYATGSSIMPQKKNPDVAELARGKTGRVYGNLMGILTVMKGLPLTYNRDLQEDKEGLFDTIDTLHSTLDAFVGMITTLKVNAARTREAVRQGYLIATDIADYLVDKDLPFREAHEVVGKLVRYAAGQQKELSQLTLSEYQSFSTLFGADVYAITPESSLADRDVLGGTAPGQVGAQIARAMKIIREDTDATG